jgi:hypothetical protein
MAQVLSIAEIKQNYPEQWVLIGNPELDNNDNILGSVVSKLLRGVVLFACKDKHDIIEQAPKVRIGFDTYTCIFTGIIPKNRKFLH